MQPRIPLPTDNIYKFYSLLGLLLLISSMAIFVSTYSSFHSKSAERFIELSVLNELESLEVKQKARKKSLEKAIKRDKTDNNFYLSFLSLLIIAGLFLMLFGFWKWHRSIQPKQDRLLDLEIEKAELEIKILKGSN